MEFFMSDFISLLSLSIFFLPSLCFFVLAYNYQNKAYKPELPTWLGFLIFPIFVLFWTWNFGWLGVFEPICKLNNSGGQYGCLAFRYDIYATLLAQIFFGFWFHIFLILRQQFWILVNSVFIFLVLFIPTFFYSIFPWDSNFSILSYLLILTGFVDILFYFIYFGFAKQLRK